MGSPSSFLIDSVPVVKVGDTKIGPIDHIVFIPAKEEFPIEFSVKGSVFSREISSIVLTSFKQDVYLYKYWASLDGRHWVKSHKLMNVQPSGGFDHSGGKILVHIDISEDP